MKFFKSLKDFVFYGCAYFTAITSVMLLLVLDRPEKVPDANRFMFFLLLSFLFSMGSTLYNAISLNKPLAICLHAAFYNLGFMLFLAISGMGFSKTIIGTLIFAVCYTVITLILRGTKKALKKLSQKEGSSKSVSKKKDAPKKSENKSANKPEKAEYKNLFS